MAPSDSSSDFVTQKVAKALMPKPCLKSRVVVFTNLSALQGPRLGVLDIEV